MLPLSSSLPPFPLSSLSKISLLLVLLYLLLSSRLFVFVLPPSFLSALAHSLLSVSSGHPLLRSISKFCPQITRALPVSPDNNTTWRSAKLWGLELHCLICRYTHSLCLTPKFHRACLHWNPGRDTAAGADRGHLWRCLCVHQVLQLYISAVCRLLRVYLKYRAYPLLLANYRYIN